MLTLTPGSLPRLETERLVLRVGHFCYPGYCLAADLLGKGLMFEALTAALGYARDYLQIDGRWEDHVLTSLTNPSWPDPEPDRHA